MRWCLLAGAALLAYCEVGGSADPSESTAADEPVFSGPQPGEPLPPFRVRGVFDDEAGKEFDFITRAAGKPILLVFVHDANRPSIGMTRLLGKYAASRAKDGLHFGAIWLEDDATNAENTLKRIRHALHPGAPTGIAVDGREGPGSYGLNREVTLTVLVGKNGKVTANFALVQPSAQADLPKILDAVVAVAGGRAPSLAELEGPVGSLKMAPREAADAPAVARLRALLRRVIDKSAEPAAVDSAAAAVTKHAEEHADAKKELGRIARTIVDAGKLDQYGTPRAREHLKTWAKDAAR